MILGIGNDLVDIRRIEKAFVRFGARFTGRIFTAAERKYAGQDCTRLAKRFAAKEACAKALGTGLGRISWQEIEVLRSPGGAPQIVLHGHALDRAKTLVPDGKTVQCFVSLSDEYPYAQAFVVIAAAAL